MGNNPRVEEPYDLSPDHTVMLGVDFQQGFRGGVGSTPLTPLRRSPASAGQRRAGALSVAR
jgi:hypothetical protein